MEDTVMLDFGSLIQGLLDTLLAFVQEYLVGLITGALDGGASLF
jgi:hypothetical protein